MLRECVSCALLLSMLTGCGGGNAPTEKVSGTVTLDGNPVEAASVAFIPDDMSTGKPAAGLTDSEGKFTLTTFVGGDGALLGSYKIQVTKYKTLDGGHNPYTDPEPVAASPPKKLTEAEEQARMEKGYTASEATPEKAKNEKPKNELPEQYAKIGTSELTYTVVAGDNNVPIELTSKKK